MINGSDHGVGLIDLWVLLDLEERLNALHELLLSLRALERHLEGLLRHGVQAKGKRMVPSRLDLLEYLVESEGVLRQAWGEYWG